MKRFARLVHYICIVLIGVSIAAASACAEPAAKTPVSTVASTVSETETQPGERIIVNTGIGYPLRPAARRVAKQTVMIMVTTAADQAMFGSGFVYRPGIIVTAEHVAHADGQPVKKITVVCDEHVTEALPLASDPLRDVAVLETDCDGSKVRLDQRPASHRERLYELGFDFTEVEVSGNIRRYVNVTKRLPDDLIYMDPKKEYSDEFKKEVAEVLNKRKQAGVSAYQPVAGWPEKGWSGSAVIRGDGGVVGLLVNRDLYAERGYYTPAANIRHVLDQAGVE